MSTSNAHIENLNIEKFVSEPLMAQHEALQARLREKMGREPLMEEDFHFKLRALDDDAKAEEAEPVERLEDQVKRYIQEHKIA